MAHVCMYVRREVCIMYNVYMYVCIMYVRMYMYNVDVSEMHQNEHIRLVSAPHVPMLCVSTGTT